MTSSLTSGAVDLPAIVFVHGFWSNSAAWDDFLRLLRFGWVGNTFELLTFEYPTKLFNLNPTKTIPEIEGCAELLDSFLKRRISGSTPLVLVSHSQGGLVVQRFVADLLQAGRGAELHRLVRIVMFACPNQGSEFFLGFRRLLLRFNPQERRLRPLDKTINDTRRVFLNRAVHAKEITQSECPIPVVAYVGLQDGIVNPQSAKDLFPVTETLNDDHSSIIKPISADCGPYRALERELRIALGRAQLIDASEVSTNVAVRPAFNTAGASDTLHSYRPTEVPRAASTLYGRTGHLRTISKALASSGSRPSSPCILLSGRGGSGKTCLVCQAALDAKQEYPDGQLFYDLANVPTESGSVLGALDHFLGSLGTPPERLPVLLDDKAALFQSLVSGRRMLVIIENATDAASVRLLLPATPGSAAVVTSRSRMDSLDADLFLDVAELEADAAVAFLRDSARRPSTKSGQPTDAELGDLAKLCGHFPLALKIASALLRRQYAGNASGLIDALGDEKKRLDILAVEDLAVRSTLAQAYELLADGARALLRRLSLLPRSDFAPWIATVALEDTEEDPFKAFDELVESNLVDSSNNGRFRMHDLVVDFARERASEDDVQAELPAATERLFNAYAARARMCRRILEPERPPFASKGSSPSEGEFGVEGIADAEQWLEQEHECLVKLMSAAADGSLTAVLVDIANSLPTYFIIRGTWNDWHPGLVLAARSAEYANDPTSMGYCLQTLANIERTLGYNTGRALIERSLQCFNDAEDSVGQAYLLNDLGLVAMYDGDWTSSVASLEQSRSLLQDMGNHHLALHPLRNLGITYLEKGELDKAIGLLDAAASGFSSRENSRWQAFTLGDLGKAYRLAGNAESANSCLRASISLLTGLGEARWCAVMKIRYGDLLRVTRETSLALSTYQEAFDAFQALPDPLWAARTLVGMSLASTEAGDNVTSLSQLDRAHATFSQLSFEADKCWAQVCRFRILEKTDVSAANRALDDAHQIANAMGYDSAYIERLLADSGPDVR